MLGRSLGVHSLQNPCPPVGRTTASGTESPAFLLCYQSKETSFFFFVFFLFLVIELAGDEDQAFHVNLMSLQLKWSLEMGLDPPLHNFLLGSCLTNLKNKIQRQ